VNTIFGREFAKLTGEKSLQQNNMVGFTEHRAEHGQELTDTWSRIPFFLIKLSLLQLQIAPKWQFHARI